MKNIVLDVVSMVLHEEAEELQDQSQHLNLNCIAVGFFRGVVSGVGQERSDEHWNGKVNADCCSSENSSHRAYNVCRND